jgi:hypothetical protein
MEWVIWRHSSPLSFSPFRVNGITDDICIVAEMNVGGVPHMYAQVRHSEQLRSATSR